MSSPYIVMFFLAIVAVVLITKYQEPIESWIISKLPKSNKNKKPN